MLRLSSDAVIHCDIIPASRLILQRQIVIASTRCGGSSKCAGATCGVQPAT